MCDKQCEELAFPVLFSYGKFGYTAERDVINYHQLNTLMPDGCIIAGGLLQIKSTFSMHSLLLSRKEYPTIFILLLRRFMVKVLQHHKSGQIHKSCKTLFLKNKPTYF